MTEQDFFMGVHVFRNNSEKLLLFAKIVTGYYNTTVWLDEQFVIYGI